MDPWRNTALQDAKTQSIAAERSTSRAQTSPIEDMPAPPAYHMVVDHAALPGLHSAYNAELEADKDEEDEIPEIAINAATQIRGNGNIISIAQMDSARIATLLANILNDIKTPETGSPTSQPGQTLPSISSLSDHVKKSFPKVNITVNCGATVIGDRNIVGPGLGDIARQMQLAQRNQALQAQQQQQQQQRCQGQARAGVSTTQQRETLYQAQASIAQNHGLHPAMNPTPPMSRSSSLQSEGTSGTKRKAEESSVDGDAKRHC